LALETKTHATLLYVQTALRAHHGKYVCAEQNHTVVANRDASGPWEQWQVIPAGSHHHHQQPPQHHYQEQHHHHHQHSSGTRRSRKP
jgi:hypothetical protein